jgi:hypothetical protein
MQVGFPGREVCKLMPLSNRLPGAVCMSCFCPYLGCVLRFSSKARICYVAGTSVANGDGWLRVCLCVHARDSGLRLCSGCSWDVLAMPRSHPLWACCVVHDAGVGGCDSGAEMRSNIVLWLDSASGFARFCLYNGLTGRDPRGSEHKPAASPKRDSAPPFDP